MSAGGAIPEGALARVLGEVARVRGAPPSSDEPTPASTGLVLERSE